MNWPDWAFGTAVIIGTGPSVAQTPLIEAQPAHCIAIKSTWRLAPWASILYGCDRGWWVEHRGVPQFKGMKISASPSVCKVYRDIRQVKRLLPRAEILTGETGVIGCGVPRGGGHSGFHAINLAVQFGAKRIVLVGFDMTLKRGAHWRTEYGSVKPDAKRVETWRVALDGCADQFKALGVEVINATPGSALTAYPMATLREAVWG